MTDDPSRPDIWWRLLVDAVAGLQAGFKEHATKYLQFVEQHRGRDVALKARGRLVEFAKCESWQGCNEWRNHGYDPKWRTNGQPQRRPGKARRK